MLDVDLHCHSNLSDGVLDPAVLAARAHAHGVRLWALTDHDELGGIPAARAAALEAGMRYVCGVEISISWAGETVHILGLQIDPQNQLLRQGLAHTRHGRLARAEEMAALLAQAGVPDALAGARRYASNPQLLGRTHFARYIVERGLCAKVSEVFQKYLTEGKPGYVPHRWASMEQALQWIHAAGGQAVVAHPGRYKYSTLAEAEMLQCFKDMGGAGIEVVTGSHSVEQYAHYANMAQHYGFLASAGSDFHAPGESRVDLGQLPAMPPGVKPIWHDW
ncbi:3',5'-nucleoside bisphosphate phosphatase [Massilia sp. W12]|uniref:3',5'-nucleoside bisphosphate phosphatase n=1 Tax=Massilia sp. W12 TaxID=3126507 RepID=UPI0030CD3A2D